MARELKFKAWLPGIKKMTYTHTLEELTNWNTKPEDNGTAIWLQCTSREDRNKKEIYEGDIVRATCGDSPLCKIEYTGTGFVPLRRSKLGGWVRVSWMYVVNGEVAGNIYENPELLKEG